MNVTTNPTVLEIRRAPTEYRVFIDEIELCDDELLDILSNDEVTLTFVCTDESASVTVAHADQGTLVYWDGPSHDFEPTAEEIALFVFIESASSTTTRTPKVKVRSPVIKPTPVFVLG